MTLLIKSPKSLFQSEKYMITVEPALAIFVLVKWSSKEDSCEPVFILKRFRASASDMNKV